jgi:hypothetical protein
MLHKMSEPPELAKNPKLKHLALPVEVAAVLEHLVVVPVVLEVVVVTTNLPLHQLTLQTTLKFLLQP